MVHQRESIIDNVMPKVNEVVDATKNLIRAAVEPSKNNHSKPTSPSPSPSPAPTPSPPPVVKRPLTPDVIGLIGLGLAVAISLLISYSVVLWLRARNRRNIMAALICGLGLMFTIVLTFVMPIDVFVVSYMKDKQGHMKPWVKDDVVMRIQNVITIVYFTLYGMLAIFVFGIMPFFYFFYDGSDFDEDDATSKVCFRAAFASFITLLLLVVICLCGVFIPTKNGNSTVIPKNFGLIGTLHPKFISTIGFVYSALVIAGIITACFYTAYGLSHTPMVLLRCSGLLRRSESTDPLIESPPRGRAHIVALNPSNMKSEFARNALTEHQSRYDLPAEDPPIVPKERGSGVLKKIANVLILYPFKILFGLLGLFTSGLMIVSLSTVCVDRWIHSSFSEGYTLNKAADIMNTTHIINPADFIITKSQQYFPLDYVIFAMMFATLLFSSLYSIKSLGIRVVFVKMYNVRPGRSNSQALICFTLLMMIICFSFSSLLYNILPTYITYGHQTYVTESNTVKMCDNSAPEKKCIETMLAGFLKTFFLKANLFASVIFYLINAFLVCFVFGIFVSVYRVCFMARDDDQHAPIHSNILMDDEELDDDDVLIA